VSNKKIREAVRSSLESWNLGDGEEDRDGGHAIDMENLAKVINNHKPKKKKNRCKWTQRTFHGGPAFTDCVGCVSIQIPNLCPHCGKKVKVVS